MMGEIVTRNMSSKAIANKKRKCCILLDLFHHYKAWCTEPQILKYRLKFVCWYWGREVGGRSKAIANVRLRGNLKKKMYFVWRVSYILYSKFLLLSICNAVLDYESWGPKMYFALGQKYLNPYPTAFPYGNGMVLHFYQQQESSTTKTVHKVINKGLKTYV